ncbi:response regulator [Endozoicomonas atrinae]|uniref:response regulator n=1 Tax=Endozoicomonas atrinae TaxID=1333660 RepID=UPI00082442D0|nr:response regulator [Endozoicomonas atrinae]
MDNSEQFKAQMRQLQKEYLTSLSGLRSELNQLLVDPELEQPEGMACSRLKTIAHNLAGTGATYGFNRISDTAAPLDCLLGSIHTAESGRSINADAMAQLQLLASELIDAINEALGDENKEESAPLKVEVTESGESGEASVAAILLIDDDIMLGKAVKLVLEQESYSTTMAMTGAEALDNIKRSTPDLIFLDINLPDTTGMALLEQLKAIPELEKTPVVMLSAVEDMEIVVNCLSRGASDYLTKPCDGAVLLDKVRDTLNHASYNILLVDDDVMITGVLCNLLNREGYQVTTCSNGIDAVQYAQEHHPDLMILDCMMPGLDGFAVLHKIRSSAETRDVPAIMLSALNQQNNIAKGLELGASDYICKPFDPVELLARVQKVLPIQ